MRNSLPGVGFRWGHCQVLFVCQHNTCKQPSANPVSHDTCTRELPPEFVKRAAEQLKIEQHWSQRSTLRNSLPGVGFRWGHCQVLFVSQHNTCKQPSANPVSHDTCTRELPPEFAETSGRAAENRATLEPTKHVAKQSSWSRIPFGALSGLVCVPTQHLQATIGESSVSRHLHTRIAARVC